MGPLPLTLNSKLENHDSEHRIMVLGIYFTPVDLFVGMFKCLPPVSDHSMCFETGVQERPNKKQYFFQITLLVLLQLSSSPEIDLKRQLCDLDTGL